MVGSGAPDRSKEAVGMMALHEALRTVCLNSDWTYSVFWTIRPRPRVRGGNGCKVGDDNGSMMLMWEDGFCKGRVAECMEEIDGEDAVRKAFSKMSIQLYNYGEGLMGKVASDKCHKWVFKEPTESEPNISNYWQSSFDALPPEWTDQFDSGIQTIAVIQAGHGLLQLGSCKIIAEDLHFVLRMRHTFESLGYQSGFYLSQLFSSTRTTNPSSSTSLSSPFPGKHSPAGPPSPAFFNWGPRTGPATMLPSPGFHNQLGYQQQREGSTHMFLGHHPQSDHQDMMGDHENVVDDIKWPNGLSFFNALTNRNDDAKLLFNQDGGDGSEAGTGRQHDHHHGGSNLSEFLSLDGSGKMENEMKYKRIFNLGTSSSSSSLMDHHHHQLDQYNKGSSEGGGMYHDVMETFLE